MRQLQTHLPVKIDLLRTRWIELHDVFVELNERLNGLL